MEYPNNKYYEYREKTEPLAEDLMKVLIGSKKSYLECLEALEIAKDKLLLTFPSR